MTAQFRLAACIACLVGSAPIEAQVPSTVQPGQIERQFQQPPAPRTKPGEFKVPLPVLTPPANGAEFKFTLTRLTLDGAKAYPESSLLPIYERYLNKQVSLVEIYEIANALTAKYRNDGYILSQVIVPAQAVEGGVVQLKVIEGYVANVKIEGDLSRRDLVQRYAEKIRTTRPLTAAVLERYLLLMNDLPGAFAQAMLAPSSDQPGASDLTIRFSSTAYSGGATVDNRGSRTLGPVRWSFDATANSAFGLYEANNIRAVTTFNGELDFVALTHDEQIGAEGGKLTAALSFVRSEPQEIGAIPLNIETSANSGSLSFSYPWIRGRAENLSVRSTFSVHNGATKVLGFQDTRDRLRVVRFGWTYDLADVLRGVNIVDAELSQGIRGAGSSNNDDANLSRSNGRVDFTKVTLYAARLQSLAPRWSLLIAANGQYAFSDLLASELFGVGGEQIGRGYDPSELVGDHGAAMKLELRYTDLFASGAPSGYTAYGFYDAGFVRQRTPAGPRAQESLTSAGLGLRFNFGRYVSGFVELAKPLTRDVAQERDRKWRSYGGFSARF